MPNSDLQSAAPGMAVGITIHRGCWGTNTPRVVTTYDNHMAKLGLTQAEYRKIVDTLNKEYEELMPEYYTATMWCCMLTVIGGIVMQEGVIMGAQKQVEDYTHKYVSELNADPRFKDRLVFRVTGFKSDYATRQNQGILGRNFGSGGVVVVTAPMNCCDGVIEVWAKNQLPSAKVAPIATGVPFRPRQAEMVTTPVDPATKEKKFCTSCGANRDSPAVLFCGSCGAKFE